MICLRPWGDGLHLPPPMGQKLSARRCVNFEVACPDFASRVQPHRHSTQACNAKCFFLSQKRPSTEHGTMRAAVNIIHGWQHPSSSRLLGKLSAIPWQSCWQIRPTLGRKFFAISPQGVGDGFGLCPEWVVLDVERWPQPPLPRVFTVESVEAAPPPPSSKSIRLVE